MTDPHLTDLLEAVVDAAETFRRLERETTEQLKKGSATWGKAWAARDELDKALEALNESGLRSRAPGGDEATTGSLPREHPQ